MARRRFIPKSGTYVMLEGQEEIQAAFATLQFSALSEARKAIADSAADIEQGAKERVPVLSGATKKSIHTRPRDGGLAATIGSGYFLAKIIEHGTRWRSGRTSPRRPFLFPAFAVVRPVYIARLEAALGRAIRQAQSGATRKAAATGTNLSKQAAVRASRLRG